MIVVATISVQSSPAAILIWLIRRASHVCTLMALAIPLTLTGGASAASLEAVLASPERPATDLERDASSRPADVLSFFGVPEGGVAIDLFAGGGYYSEILSRAMGTDSTVYLHNNKAYLNFAGEALEARLANGRLPRVVRYDRELDDIDLADASVDLVLMVMTYHDLYYKTDGWDLDPDAFFTMVRRILKPDGVLAIVDHAAAEGSGKTAAQDLHRIEAAFALADISSHGFKLVAVSDLLHNPDDPLDVSVFDDSIRGRTSKFLMKFVEAAN